ncbi:SapC family protein [Halomonas sp. AOP43-A1-21]
MSRFVPISRSSHKDYAWLKAANYDFIVDQQAIVLAGQELPPALATMPVGFRQSGAGKLELVAICSLSNQQNLFVHSDGRWLAAYRPALLRTYPFLLQKGSNDQHVLCIDEQSGLLVDGKGSVGEPLFNEAGELSETLSQIFQFLSQWERQRQNTQKAVDMLASFNLIVPWDVKMQSQEGNDMPGLKGFYRIDEKALNALSADKLDALRQLGGLTIAYAQLFSQHRLSVLTRLYNLHQQDRNASNAEVDLESLFDGSDDGISFDFDS